jgi:hypothetical protein
MYTILRQAQHRYFDKLSTGTSTSSAQVLRQAQHRYFDRLSTGTSTSSAQVILIESVSLKITFLKFDIELYFNSLSIQVSGLTS